MRAIPAISGTILGFAVIGLLLTKAPKRKQEVAKKDSDEKPTLLRFEIEDKCPCGETVKKFERHELVFSEKLLRWFRACESCIINKVTWADNDGPAEIVTINDRQKVVPISEAHCSTGSDG